MSALNDVLKAEQKADEAIETTKKEVEAKIASARTEQKERLEAEQKKLQESGEVETKVHQVQVDELAKKIVTDTEAQVVAIEQRFSDKKDSLKTALRRHFR